jgi:hypothetical protein
MYSFKKSLFIKLSIFILVFGAISVYATKTFVYVDNHTPYTFKAICSSAVEEMFWEQTATMVPPFTRSKVLSYKRGIKGSTKTSQQTFKLFAIELINKELIPNGIFLQQKRKFGDYSDSWIGRDYLALMIPGYEGQSTISTEWRDNPYKNTIVENIKTSNNIMTIVYQFFAAFLNNQIECHIISAPIL